MFWVKCWPSIQTNDILQKSAWDILISKVTWSDLQSNDKEMILTDPFDWTIDNFEPTETILKELIIKEAMIYK